MERRRFLQGAALAAVTTLGWPRVAPAATPDPRFVLIILRGGLDGLAAIAPYGDPAYREIRGELAMDRDKLLKLNDFFATHPALANFHRAFRAGEAAVVHAVASPYRERSHFDAQNVLESGLATPYATDQGWLNRVLAAESERRAIAIAPTVPLVLRGTRTVSSWSPSVLPEPNDGIMERLLDLYDTDVSLGPSLRSGLAVDALAGTSRGGAGGGNPSAPLPMDAVARFLAAPAGPRIAVVEVGGWDTHANQTAQLAGRLRSLDEGLGRIATGLGAAWRQTVVLVVSEFGRTAAPNGTRGTDHGTAGVALLAGGAVNGGRVVTEWPGLARSSLHQGRDLAPTLDVRALFAALLRKHLGLGGDRLDAVFPGVARHRRLEELIA